MTTNAITDRSATSSLQLGLFDMRVRLECAGLQCDADAWRVARGGHAVSLALEGGHDLHAVRRLGRAEQCELDLRPHPLRTRSGTQAVIANRLSQPEGGCQRHQANSPPQAVPVDGTGRRKTT